MVVCVNLWACIYKVNLRCIRQQSLEGGYKNFRGVLWVPVDWNIKEPKQGPILVDPKIWPNWITMFGFDLAQKWMGLLLNICTSNSLEHEFKTQSTNSTLLKDKQLHTS